MPKQKTGGKDGDKAAEVTAAGADPDRLGESEASSFPMAVQKEKEAADRTHMTVKAKPNPSPHKVRKS